MDFNNRVALITGAGSEKGIGREVARQLSYKGAITLIADIDKEGVENTVAELQKNKGEAYPIQLDVSDRLQVSEKVREVINKFNKIDILINNAGITRPTGVLDITEEEWDLIFSVNMKGCFFLTQAVLPYMKERNYGRIVSLSSVSGKRGGGIFGGAHYSAAKAGVTGFSKAIAREMAPFGITCNSVAPGLIGTEITGGLLTEEKKEALASGIPVGRIGTVEEVANTIIFLASEGASYITGEEVDVNGGSHID